MSLKNVDGHLVQIPGTILERLEVPMPPKLIAGIELSQYNPTKQVVVVHLDNFGLLEVALHKPQFLLKACNMMITLETQDGYAQNVATKLAKGNLEDGFNLFSYLEENYKKAVIVDREKQRKIAGIATFRPAESDMNTYIETAKLLNRSDLLLIHFLDFDELYRKHTNRPPLELAQKLLHRTDRWLLGFYKQAIPNTLFLILGNQGQRDYGLKYESKYQNWAQANVPICLIIHKSPEARV